MANKLFSVKYLYLAGYLQIKEGLFFIALIVRLNSSLTDGFLWLRRKFLSVI
jgi:hypothetical protein